MRKEHLREGAVVRCKAAGREKDYVIRKFNNNSFCAVEILPEEDEEMANPDVIEITDDNLILFRYKYLSVPEEIPNPEEFSVRDGVLYKGDKKVFDQGEIVVEKILGALEGHLVMLIKRGDFSHIVTYRLERDALCYVSINLEGEVKTISYPQEESGELLIGVSATKEREFNTEDEKGTVKKTVLTKSLIIELSKNGKIKNVTLIDDIAEDVRVHNNIISYTTSVSVDNDGAIEKIEPVVRTLNNSINNLNLKGTCINAITKANGEIYKTIETDKEIRVLTPYKDFSLKLSGLKGYYLVEENEEENLYFFTNKDLNIKKVKVKETEDRGLVVTYL